MNIEHIFRKFRIAIAKLKTTIHGLSKPDMFLLSPSICPPVLTWNSQRTSLYACFPSFHVTEYFDSIHLATLVRINPIFSTLEFRMAEFQVSAVPSRVFTRTIRTNEAFYLSVNRFQRRHNFFSVDFEIHWFISIIWCKTTRFFTSNPT